MNNGIPIVNEYAISQKPALEVLEKLGYRVIPNEHENKEYNNLTIRKGDLGQVLLKDILEKKINEINSYEYNGKEYKFAADTIGQAIKDLDISLFNGLIKTNESIYDLLTLGKSYSQKLIDGSERSFDIKFIDFDNPERNDFYVTTEYSVLRTNGRETARPDIVLFINGIPVVVIECKGVSVSVDQGISQNIRNQKVDYIPELMKFIQILVSTNKNEFKYATVGTTIKYWMEWREKEEEWHNNILSDVVQGRKITRQDKDLVSLFEPKRLLEIIKDFVIFEAGTKKVPRYQQYFATKATVKRLTVDKKGGVIWHTQGSGKSITMVYITNKLMTSKMIKNPQVLVVTDRVDLDKQIMKTFTRIGIKAKRAGTGNNLVELIKDENIRVITSVVNKFKTVVNKGVEVDAQNTFILVDEGHRSEYGELNRKMREVFKNALYVSFTGTPITKKDRNIFEKFGGLIDKYTLDDALRDGAIVPLYYEGKMVDQEVSKESMEKQLELITRKLNEQQKKEVYKKWSSFEKVASTEKRINFIAMDIAESYMKFLKNTNFTAMLATNKKIDAVRYYNFFEENYPELNTAFVISQPDLREGEDSIDDDTKDIVKKAYLKCTSGYANPEEYEETIKSKFVNGDIDILIVVDKLLTGFDAPKASVLYLDKQIREHNLLQAIARVNRLCEGKDCGYIVDYRGLMGELDKALNMYKDAGLEGFDEEDIQKSVYKIDAKVDELHESYQELENVFDGIKNKKDMEEYEEYLADEEIRKDFYDKLCRFGSTLALISLSDRGYYKVGQEKMDKYKRAFVFYQTLRRTVKIRYSESIDHKEYETKMQKLLDDYVIAKDVMRITEPVDINNVAEFNKELSRIETRAGKADAIVTRLKKSMSTKYNEDPAFYKKFSEKIEETIKAYREKRIDDSKYLECMNSLADDYRKGNVGINYPSSIKDGKSRAFYGVIYEKFKKLLGGDVDDEEIGTLTKDIQAKIEDNIKVDWKRSEDAINAMKQEIDDTLYYYLSDKGITIDFDEMDNLIETIIEVTISNY